MGPPFRETKYFIVGLHRNTVTDTGFRGGSRISEKGAKFTVLGRTGLVRESPSIKRSATIGWRVAYKIVFWPDIPPRLQEMALPRSCKLHLYNLDIENSCLKSSHFQEKSLILLTIFWYTLSQ